MKKVLIANRGEIAVRIIRACKDYGVRSVAVYASSDREALHVSMADEAYSLTGERPQDSYLHQEKLLALAQKSAADAVHPGYGFLSENAGFAHAVQAAGLKWIGPNPDTIQLLGDKVAARKIAQSVGAPLVQGTSEPVSNAQEVLNFVQRYGLPVVIKAAHGGGGRGMKVAWHMGEVEELYASAVREAMQAFGRGECFVEQFLAKPRHIEAQVLADQHGQVLVVGTRDCSLQRRNQKLVEEAPAPFLSPEQHTSITAAAQAICRTAGYCGVGTVEFLLAQNGVLSFLEVNTRLQVEHPVTEETSGLDLVLEQLRIADGLHLSSADAPEPRGHAFEFRINAEDVARGFLPTPGTITLFEMPSGPGVRVDSGVRAGSVVSGAFDSLLAKLIVTGANRAQALARAKRALAEFNIAGVASVLPFHQALIHHPDFAKHAPFRVHTRWIETDFAADLQAATRAIPDSRMAHAMIHVPLELDGRRVVLGLPRNWQNTVGLDDWHAWGPAQPKGSAPLSPSEYDLDTSAVLSPLHGQLLAWKIAEGATVQAGDVLAVMETMKMETHVTAQRSGQLTQCVAAGGTYRAESVLARIVAHN